MINTEKEWITYLQGKENLYLYGAGKRAQYLLYYCKKSKIRVNALLVSQRRGNPLEKEGLPVLALDELDEEGLAASDLHVVVTLAGGMKQWLDDFCQMPPFKSLMFISDRLYSELNRRMLQYRYEDQQDRYRLEVEYPEMEPEQGLVVERAGGQAILRLPLHARQGMLQPLLDFGTRKEFEREFGPLRLMPTVTGNGITSLTAKREKIEIYVATSHMDTAEAEEIRQGAYLPIQVGARLTDVRKGCLTDDTGDHISHRNRDYCECTGLYWIWKNTSGQEYVGLAHYRRRLKLDDGSAACMKEQGIDLVVGHPQFEMENIRDFFAQYIYRRDWALLKGAVCEYDKGYADCFARYEEGHFYFPCNVALWKREWFDRYCRFAFSVASNIDAFYQERGILREDRYMGYLFEQLSTLFMMRHYRDMKIACTQIQWIV